MHGRAVVGPSSPVRRNVFDAGSRTVAPCLIPADFGFDTVGDGPIRSRHADRTPVPDIVRSKKLPGGEWLAWDAVETAALQALACDHNVVRIAPHAHVMSYRDGEGRPATFVPPVTALHRDGQVEVVALLPSWRMARSDPRWRRKEASLRAAYRAHGATLSVWTDLKLFAPAVERRNRERMLKERAGEDAVADVTRARAEIRKRGLPTTVAAVKRGLRLGSRSGSNRTLAAVIELALDGVVALDLRRPLGDATRITRGAFA